jgi:hypothetical protein
VDRLPRVWSTRSVVEDSVHRAINCTPQTRPTPRTCCCRIDFPHCRSGCGNRGCWTWRAPISVCSRPCMRSGGRRTSRCCFRIRTNWHRSWRRRGTEARVIHVDSSRRQLNQDPLRDAFHHDSSTASRHGTRRDCPVHRPVVAVADHGIRCSSRCRGDRFVHRIALIGVGL